jgi:hypothetical protein
MFLACHEIDAAETTPPQEKLVRARTMAGEKSWRGKAINLGVSKGAPGTA